MIIIIFKFFILGFVNALQPTEIQVANEKIVNQIYLNTVAQGIGLSRNDKPALQSIANQCPIIGGKAVYLARSLYTNYTITHYDDIAICAVQGISFRTKKPKVTVVKATEYSIAPNPAANFAVLKSTTALEGDGVVSLYDIYGRLLATYRMPIWSNQVNIVTDNLPSGIYTCRLNIDNINVFTTKLSIVK